MRHPNAAGGGQVRDGVAGALARVADRPVESMMGYLLRRANNRYHQYWADNFTLSDGTLTSMQAGMLLAIDQWGPITQTEIAHRMNIKLPTALHSTNHLETLHYIERTKRDDDRRSYTLRLTAAGAAALATVMAAVAERDAALLAPLDAAERALLLSLLARIALAG